MAFTQVQPVCLSRFLRKRNCISYASNFAKNQVYCCTFFCNSTASYPQHQKKEFQILINKIHPEYQTLNFVGHQSSFKSLTSIKAGTFCVYSTNRPEPEDESSQATIYRPKGTAPACSTVLPLHVLSLRCGLV